MFLCHYYSRKNFYVYKSIIFEIHIESLLKNSDRLLNIEVRDSHSVECFL